MFNDFVQISVLETCRCYCNYIEVATWFISKCSFNCVRHLTVPLHDKKLISRKFTVFYADHIRGKCNICD